LIDVDTQLGIEQIHALEDGVGSHVSIVWHGFDSVNRFYHWNYLLKYGQLVRAGLPGHGPVREVRWSRCKHWSVEHLTETARVLCQRYRSETPLTLVGHSTGAHVALCAAISAPELVGRLILVNPLVWSPMTAIVRLIARTWFWRWIATAALVPGIKRKRRSINSFLEGLRPIIGDTEGFFGNSNTVEYTRAGHDDYKRSSLAAILSTARICSTFDLRGALKSTQLTAPVLIVHGQEDRVSPIEQAEWLGERLPRATLVRLPRVGHLSYAEREREFGDLVTMWLDRHLGRAENVLV